MAARKSIKSVLLVTSILVTVLSIFLFLGISYLAFSVWDYIVNMPWWLVTLYILTLLSIIILAITISYHYFLKKPTPPSTKKIISFNHLKDDIQQKTLVGINTIAANVELDELTRRQEQGDIYIVIFGRVNVGKSSLIQALIPETEIVVDAVAGATKAIQHHHWTTPAGDNVQVTDIPGTQAIEESNVLVFEEAQRAHLVVYVCDSDLTQSQWYEITLLANLNKPTLIVINKSDLYEKSDLVKIKEKIAQQASTHNIHIITVSAGRKDLNIEPDIFEFKKAINQTIDKNKQQLNKLRDESCLTLAAHKLDQATKDHQQMQAQVIIKQYSKKAAIGALAAIAPGSDLIIQGIIGTQLIRELSNLYQVPIKEIEITRFLKLANNKLRNTTSIILAISGNALKAFPGIGTISGGLTHAVAYGMIIDSLGKSIAETLAVHHQFSKEQAYETLEEKLNENMENSANYFAEFIQTQKKQT